MSGDRTLSIRDIPSPNRDPRPAGVAIDTVVIHYTGMRSAAEALARLCDPEAKVSAHYCIDEDGSVTRLVPEELRAWHAGVSSWRGDSDINGRSIGIELVNPGHEYGYRPFPEAQMAALIALLRDILRRHPIPPSRILGHSDVAPARKTDPGELFDWARLARAGIGLWPDETAAISSSGPGDPSPAAPEVQSLLAAFQRHFRPGRADGVADGETLARLRWLAGRAMA